MAWNRIVPIIVVFLLVCTPAAAVGGQQNSVGWTVRANVPLYYIGDLATVTVTGPPGAYFILYMELNGTVVKRHSGTVGSNGVSNITMLLYPESYSAGDYVLNLTHMDEGVALGFMSVVFDQERWNNIRLDRITNEDLPTLYENASYQGERIGWLTEKLGKTGWVAALGFSAGAMAMFMCITYIMVPRSRYYLFIKSKKASALRGMGRKIDLDIFAANSINHPVVKPGEYEQIVERLRKLGMSDEDIQYALWQETGEWCAGVKLMPVATIGPYVVFRKPVFGRKDGGGGEDVEAPSDDGGSDAGGSFVCPECQMELDGPVDECPICGAGSGDGSGEV